MIQLAVWHNAKSVTCIENNNIRCRVFLILKFKFCSVLRTGSWVEVFFLFFVLFNYSSIFEHFLNIFDDFFLIFLAQFRFKLDRMLIYLIIIAFRSGCLFMDAEAAEIFG